MTQISKTVVFNQFSRSQTNIPNTTQTLLLHMPSLQQNFAYTLFFHCNEVLISIF